MKKIIAVGLLLFAGLSHGWHPIHPVHHPRTKIPSECNYERFYPGLKVCHNKMWTISIEEECKIMWATYPDGLVKDDPVCAAWKP